MKTKLSKLQRWTLTAWLSAAVLPAAWGTTANWVNNGTITFPPNIDSTNIINNGTLGSAFIPLFTTDPFDTSNTLNVTNNGVMNGSVGFRFDTAPRNSSGVLIGPRKLARSFHNRAGASVTAIDGFLPNGYNGSYLWVHATNIFSQGFLTAGAGGEVKVIGTNVNLSRGGVQASPISAQGTSNGETNFLPDTAIYDLFWGQSNLLFDSSEIITGQDTNIFVLTPVFPVQGGAFYQFGFVNPLTAGYSNLVGLMSLLITNSSGEEVITNVVTNFTHQAVFVDVSDRTNVGVTIMFTPSSSPTNDFMTVGVQLGVQGTNQSTQLPELTTLFLADTLASEPERGLLANANGGGFRPANYWLSRVALFEGLGPNVPVTTNFLWNTNWGDPVVNGEYAAYGAFVDNLLTTPPTIPAGTVSNLPGRVTIVADNLDLTRTRIRAEGLIMVESRNTITSSNAILDSEHLSFKLTSTTGTLQVQNLMKQTVARTRGDVYAWSGLWNNTITQLIENYTLDTDENLVLSPITNVVNVGLHVLMLDAQVLLTQLPVTVYDLQANSTNISISDTGTIAQSFRMNGQSLTVSGGLTLSGVLESWGYTNTPGLRYFTNTGTILVPNEAHFGDDAPGSYLTFVNRGSISADSFNLQSAYVNCGGLITVPASVVVDSPSARFESGTVNAGYDITLQAGVLRLHQQNLTAQNGALFLLVTNTLTDSGGSASNVVEVHNGFHLPNKPTTGDLLGTHIRTSPLQFAEAVHTWSGQDRGATPAGFKDNAAVGRLSMSVGLFSLLSFVGASTTPGVTNALYVDYLDLDASVASDLAGTLSIAPNLIIYFADASVDVHSLDGQFGGRLRWVRSFAGPNSSVLAVINGALVPVNRALRQSLQIDSDADGLANGFDASPFDPVSFNITAVANHAVLSWRGAVGTAYTVEWATNISTPTWQFLLNTNHPWSSNATIAVRDPEPMGPISRLYRVSYAP